jgi:hypothetical protein
MDSLTPLQNFIEWTKNLGPSAGFLVLMICFTATVGLLAIYLVLGAFTVVCIKSIFEALFYWIRGEAL